MLKNMPVRRKLVAVLAAPVIVLIALAVIGIRDRLDEAATAGDIEVLAEIATAGGPALRDVVLEQAGAERLVLGEGAVNFESRMRFTDQSLDRFADATARASDLAVAQDFKARLTTARSEAASIGTVRELTMSPGASPQDVRVGYTDLAGSIEQVINGAGTEATALREQSEFKVWWYAIGAALGLLAAVLMALIVGRSITRPLERLTVAADELAHERLPAMVEHIRMPGSADPNRVRAQPIQVETGDEIGALAHAFNDVQTTTVEVAEQQADLVRRGIGDIFVNLARRNQNLLDRQIEFIDQLEARETDADRLEQLFKLDHLATRMRRNAESLLVLADATPSRRKLDPVPLSRVVRVSIGEVEDFARVQVMALDDLSIQGNAAVDVAHLLAELMDNASQYSSPDTTVEVVGHAATNGDGYVIAVRDRGIGMNEAQLAHANQLLGDPPPPGLSASTSLGFNVVGRIAQRFGISVRLRPSEDGGVVALVALPAAIVTETPPGAHDPLPATAPVQRPRPEAQTRRVLTPDGDGYPLPARRPLHAATTVTPPESVLPTTGAGLPQRHPGATRGADATATSGRVEAALTTPRDDAVDTPGDAGSSVAAGSNPVDVAMAEVARARQQQDDDAMGIGGDDSPATPADLPDAESPMADDDVGLAERVPVGPPSSPSTERGSLGLVRRTPGEGLSGIDTGVSAATRTRVAATTRSPDEVRAMLSRYRSGLTEGRAHPEGDAGYGSDAPLVPDATEESPS